MVTNCVNVLEIRNVFTREKSSIPTGLETNMAAVTTCPEIKYFEIPLAQLANEAIIYRPKLKFHLRLPSSLALVSGPVLHIR